jgi:hypothetical protein
VAIVPGDKDSFSGYERVIGTRELGSPWAFVNGRPKYTPDIELLAEVFGIPVSERRSQTSGRYAKAIDAWCAHELRRAGFDDDEVWPRLYRPRVLPRDVAMLLADLPQGLRRSLEGHLLRNKRVAPSEAKLLGRVFLKQADVLIAQWSHGAELMISTKTMFSSFRNNLRNRFEESYGDAKNLRGRFPLLSLGFLFLMRSTVESEPDSLEIAIDMLRKLREDVDVYDATSLLVAEWDESFAGVRFRDELVPLDLRVDQFLEVLIEKVLRRTPVQFHVRVRELREHRELPLEEGADVATDGDDDDDGDA